VTASLLVALLLGCTEPDAEPTSKLVAIDGGSPVSVEISGGAGVGTVELPVRLVDEYGASVAGGTIGVALQGEGVTLQDSELQLDSEGYAVARVVADAPGPFEVTTVSSEDGAAVGTSAQGIALGAPTPSLALDTILPPPGDSEDVFAMARGTGGVALASDNTVWWMPAAQGVLPWTVLTPPFVITGMRAAELDSDGVRDLIVWGEDQVVLLRGRAGGGYSWGAGWQSTDMTVVGASVADVDSDLHADVVIGLTADETGRIELLKGDGVWGFEPVAPLDLTDPIMALVAADEDADGRPDVTAMDSITGYLHRYSRDELGWIGNSPSLLDRYGFPTGSELLPPSDLDGDGVKDIIGLASPGSGAQSVVFYILDEDKKYEQSYARIWADLADVDDDGATDLLLMEDGLLHRIRWDASADSFVLQSYSALADAGPTAVGDVDGDGVADVAVLNTAAVVVHRGMFDPGGTWSVGDRSLLELGKGFTEDFVLEDLDEDGDLDIVGFGLQGGAPAMKVWQASWSDEEGPIYDPQPAAPLQATGRVLDFTHCGEDWYVVADNSGAKDAHPNMGFRLRMEGETGLEPVVGDQGGVDGSLVACGYPQKKYPDKRRFTVADTGGHWVMYNYLVSIQEEGDLGPVDDIDYADTDGDAIDELIACDVTDCEIRGVDLDRDGIDEVVRNEGTISIEGWGDVLTLEATGRMNVGDADGDGALDIVVADPADGQVVVVPTLRGALAPPFGWYTTEVISGPVHPTDYDGDGRPELIWRQDTLLVGTERSLPPDEQ